MGVAPYGRLRLWNSHRYIRLNANDLSVNLLDQRTWQLGPLLSYRMGRNDVDDDVVERMRKIDNSVEAGLTGSWSWIDPRYAQHRFNLSVDFLHDVSSEHEGFVVNTMARYWRPVSRRLVYSLGLGTTFASDNFNSTFFGVNATDSAASRLPGFTAEGGIRDIRVPPAVVWSMSKTLHFAAGLVYGRLLGDAADSPVVDMRGSKNRFVTVEGLVRTW